ncbi:MAG: hypothetical protein ACM3PF_13825 [Bacteroidota bacterium]
MPVSDSTRAWLPAEPDELEAPDRLEDRDPVGGAGARADMRERRLAPRRLWIERKLPILGMARGEWLFDAGASGGATAQAHPLGGRVTLAAGAVVARGAPVLLGEGLGLVRALRAPRSPIFSAPAFEAPRGSSSPAVRGGAVAASLGPATVWALAGRAGPDRGDRVWAGGCGIARGALRLAAATGEKRGTRRAASLAAEARGPEGRLAFEALLSRERGPEYLGEATRAAGALAVTARWRRRPGEARPVAGEVAVESGPPALRLRLSWRPWSARAAADDGRIELETSARVSGRGPARLRLGAKGGAGTIGSADVVRGERYVIADVVVARERGRSLALLVSARETRRGAASAVASALGGRLEMAARGRAGTTLVLQARRAVSDVATADDGATAAWTTAVAPSDGEALVARAGSGLFLTGRAWLRLGAFRLEGTLADASASAGGRSAAGSLRIEWEREDR